MSEKTVINLRMARKDKQRVEKRKKGDANSIKFGRTKAEALEFKARNALNAAHLDAHKLDE